MSSHTKLNHGRIYTLKGSRQPGAAAPTANTNTITLLQYLLQSTVSFAEPGWRRRILRGDIFIDDSIVTDADHSLALLPGGWQSSSQVSYHRPPWREPVIVLKDTTIVSSSTSVDNDNDENDEYDDVLKILHRDDHLMVVHKPSGLPTMHSQTFFEYTILHALRNSTKFIYLAPPQPVHRLGVGTSGVLLIATSNPARQALSLAIREKRVTKVYRALVSGGATIPDFLRIDCPIGPVPFPIGGGTIYAACPITTTSDGETNSSTSKGKSSLSLVSVVRRNMETDEALVDVEIPTGRPHQIRIHMAYVGHPLVGDPLYRKGGVPDRTPRFFSKQAKEDEDMDTDDEDVDDAEGNDVLRVALPRDCGYSLHAHKITVEHPITGKSMTFTATPPQNLV